MWYKNTKFWLWFAIVAAVVIVLYTIYYFGKKAGLKTNAPEIPGDSKTNPLTETELSTIRDLTTRLKDDISGFISAMWRDSEAYYSLEKSSDRIFIGVANLYKYETGNSIFSDLQNEFTPNPALVDSSRRIIQRSKNLNLV